MQTDEAGNLVSFDAFCHSARLTAFIELRDPEDPQLVKGTRDFLESLRTDPRIQLDLVLDAKEAEREYGLAGPFDFVIESRLPISFDERTRGDSIWGSLTPDYNMVAATHGGSPRRQELTTFFACGPSIKPTVVADPRSMVDLAPTMASICSDSQ